MARYAGREQSIPQILSAVAVRVGGGNTSGIMHGANGNTETTTETGDTDG